MTTQSQEIQTFKYAPPADDAKRTVMWLAKTDMLFADVQILREGGGETSMHSHAHLDGFWFVLSGRVRFYGDGNTLVGEFGKYQGVLIPRGAPYWFERVGPEPLEILQIEASDKAMLSMQDLMADRIEYAPRKTGGMSAVFVEAERV